MEKRKLIFIWVFMLGAYYHLNAQIDPMLPWSNINPHPEFQVETIVKALLNKENSPKNKTRIEGWKEVENPDSIRGTMASDEIGEIIYMSVKTINRPALGNSPGLGIRIGNWLVDFTIHKTFEHTQTRERMTVLRAFQKTGNAEYGYLLWGHISKENDFAYCLGIGRRFPFQTSQTGKPSSPSLVYPGGHTARIAKVKFSRDGNSIFSGGNDYNIKQWDLRSGMEISDYDFHEEGIASIETSYDGTKVFSTDYKGTGLIWDIQYGQTMRQYKTWNLRNIIIHPDWKFMVSIEEATSNVMEPSRKGKVINVTNFDTDLVYSVYYSPEEPISHPSFIPGTNRLLFFQERKAMVYDFDLRKIVYSFLLPFRVSKMAISPDGKKMAITDLNFNSPIEIWDIESGRRFTSFPSGHEGNIMNLHFTQDGKKLISSAQKLKVWDAFSFGLIATYSPTHYDIFSIDSSPDGRLLVIGGGVPSYGVLMVLNLETGQVLFDFSTQKEVSIAIDVSPNGSLLASGGGTTYGGRGYHRLNLWDINNIFLKEIFPVPHSRILTIDFSQDGNYLLTGQENYSAYKLWDIPNNQELKSIGNKSSIFHSHFLQGENRLLTSDGEGFIKLWDLQNGNILLNLNQANFGNFILSIESLDLSADGKLVLASSGGQTTLWDLETEEKKLILNGEYGRFLPGQEKVIISFKNSVFVHDLNGELINQFWDTSCKDGLSWQFVPIPDTSEIIIYCGENLKKWDYEKRTELVKFETASKRILAAAYSPRYNLLLSAANEGFIEAWDAFNGRKVATLFAVGEKGWLVSTPELYYRANRGALNGIGFKQGELIFPFDQFDLRLNRPDKVLESFLPFGADSNLIHIYRQAYLERLQKYGFTEEMLSDDYHVPECAITNSDQLPIATGEGTVQLEIEALDTLRLLDRLNVFVNDVPIYSIQGIDLRAENTQAYTTTLNIPLSSGENKIQISALNQGGAESLKATTYVTYNAPETNPDLYLITIGTSDYQATGKDLQYAAKDARDIAALYENASGFGQVHTKVLTDTQVTKSNILAIRAWLEQSRVDDQVLIYVSGHGLLDGNYDFYYATHDVDFARPSEKGILYDDIEGLLDGIPARKKLLLMDACHSGEYDADAPPLTAAQQDSLAQKGVSFKGFSKGDGEGGPTLGLQNSFEMMQQLFADLRRGSGATVISSSSGVQVSYEDAEWQNGAFTYAFLYGLKSMKADANRDGQVTASEIQTFVAEFVPRLTEGLQVPTFRRENLEFDFRVW